MADTWAKERATLAVREVAELGDRTSPNFDEAIMLVTDVELGPIIEAALREAEQRILARLRDPDEAMLEAIDEAYLAAMDTIGGEIAVPICKTLADILEAPPQEETDPNG